MRYLARDSAVRLETAPDGLALTTPYDAAFVAALKATVPGSARAWQKPRWIIAPQFDNAVAELVETFFAVRVAVPAITASPPAAPALRALKLEYLGRCKVREDGVSSAYGYVDGGWNLIIPEAVLRAFFGAQDTRPGEAPTLYAVLGVAQSAGDDDLKRAWRRLALQWHPDRCKEPDAVEQFRRIQHAYDVLKNPVQRKKYNAGLALEAMTATLRRGANGYDNAASVEYRAPLRCGLLLVEGQPRIGRLVATTILEWQDITDQAGRTMSVSWPAGAATFEISWI